MLEKREFHYMLKEQKQKIEERISTKSGEERISLYVEGTTKIEVHAFVRSIEPG